MTNSLAEVIADAFMWPGYYRGADWRQLRWDDTAQAVENWLDAQGTSASGQDATRLEGEAPQARSPEGDAP